MKVYNKQHSYYCGIDLHARTMFVCILDDAGQKVYHKNIPCKPDRFLQARRITQTTGKSFRIGCYHDDGWIDYSMTG